MNVTFHIILELCLAFVATRKKWFAKIFKNLDGYKSENNNFVVRNVRIFYNIVINF